MGRGPTVEKKKSQSNALKTKVFAIHSKLISIAAKKGGDPDQNPSLAEAIAKARKDNVPNDNITKAIKIGTGENKDATEISQIDYEGYGAGGVAFIVSTLTDNKNRTASNIRHIFSKYGGNMGEPGSVSFSFNRRGVIFISLEKYSFEQIEELVYETNAIDFVNEGKNAKIVTSVEELSEIKDFFKSKNIELEVADIDYLPQNTVEITEFDKALKLIKMIDSFEEDEDVENVSHNLIIDEKLKAEVEKFIEDNTFKC